MKPNMTKEKNKSAKKKENKSNKKLKSDAKKYDRQRKLAAARQRKCKANMSEERLEAKRKRDRERYYRLKTENKIKHVKDMTEKEQRKVRSVWKKKQAAYRQKKKEEKARIEENTPPQSDVDEEGLGPNVPVQQSGRSLSRQKEVGRRNVRRDKAKVYRHLKQVNKENEKLKREVAKLRKRLSREKEKGKKTNQNCVGQSPSPMKKVTEVLGEEKVSPSIKKRLFVGYALEKQLKENIKSVKARGKDRHTIHRSIGSNIIKKYRIQNALKSVVPYHYNRNEKMGESSSLNYNKKTYRTLKVEEARRIRTFFQDDSVSKMLPGKKDFVKRNGLKKQRRVLLDSMKNLHDRFIKETNIKMCYATFTKCRPFWVTRPKLRDRETCACIKHENVDLLVSALRKCNVIEYKDTSDLLKSVVCSDQNEVCMTNKCNDCQSKVIVFSTDDNDIEVTYWKWTSVTEKKMIKTQEKKIKRTIKTLITSNLAEVRGILKFELDMLKNHTFSMTHQSKVLKDTRETLTENKVLFQIDFSQNYVCKCSTEIQSMHFGASKRQISLHTVVRYHKENKKVVSKSYCTASDNLDHQAHGVWAHFKPVLEDTALTFPETKSVVIFSDSPSSQYRNKTNIYLMASYLPTIFKNLEEYTWNFSEPGHGKGSMDGVGGSLKRNADNHVLHGKDITSASDLVRLFQNSSTKVFEIRDDEVEDMKASVPNRLDPIKGIMGVKQITWGRMGILNVRKLSCMECKPGEKCKHYHLKNVKFEVTNSEENYTNHKIRLKQKNTKKTKLQVSDVYSSDSDVDEETPMTPDDPELKLIPLQYDLITQGAFVLVEFSYESNRSLSKKFVAVVQEEIGSDRDVNVMFMKQTTKPDKSLFYADENDISYISCDQILAVLPSPNMVVKGDRIFYRFPGSLTL